MTSAARFDFGTVSSTGLAGAGTLSRSQLRALRNRRRRLGGEPRHAARHVAQAGAELLRRCGQLPHLPQRGRAERRAPAGSITTRPSRASTPRTRSRATNTTPRPRRPISATAHREHRRCASPFATPTPRRPARRARLLRHLRRRQAERPGPLLRPYAGEPPRIRWHNLVRYGIARKREQAKQFEQRRHADHVNFGACPAMPPTRGLLHRILRQRRHHSRSQRLHCDRPGLLLPARQTDQDSNRDELYYQSDYSFAHWLTALFGFRYENERGSYVSAFSNEKIAAHATLNTHCSFRATSRTASSTRPAEASRRTTSTASPARRAPASRYAPVRPGTRWFHGTLLRVNAATGVQEPTLGIQFASLYTQLQQAGDTADIAKYHVMPAGAAALAHLRWRRRPEHHRATSWCFKADYFHSTFNHQLEGVDSGALEQIFGYSPSVAAKRLHALPQLARVPRTRDRDRAEVAADRALLLRGGYTYLDAVVTQSFSSDAVNDGRLQQQSQLPGIAIGAEGPLIGARPFRRPPHTGFFAVQYTGNRLGAALQGCPRQPVRRLHLPRRLRHQLRQLARSAQPRPGLRLCQAGRQPDLCRQARASRSSPSSTICSASSTSAPSAIRRCRLPCGRG